MHQGNTTFNTEEIEIHIRTYRSLLKSTGMLRINQLTDSHLSMESILHEKGLGEKIDVSAFIYVLLRLPPCMSSVSYIVLGQSYDVFKNHNFAHIGTWKEALSPGRRRKMYFNGKDTLAIYIASVTDVDDIISLLTAFQIEWNKLHNLLTSPKTLDVQIEKIINQDDLDKIKNIWGKDYYNFLKAIHHRTVDFNVRLLAGSYVEYAKATQKWWSHISNSVRKTVKTTNRPIYFISSNTHSVVNLLTRFVKNPDVENTLVNYLEKINDCNLTKFWNDINSGNNPVDRENFLYYLAKKYSASNPNFRNIKNAEEKILGIHTVSASHYLDITAQIIQINKLTQSRFGQKTGMDLSLLKNSNAIIVNIDYPLGWAAYQVLTEIGQNITQLRGIYIMGKAATLNGQIGDILLSSSVFDQHTKNIYAFDNCLKSENFLSLFKTGTVIRNQKTIAVKGTFYESNKLIKRWYSEGYCVIEMESGPFLNAVYEFIFYNRYTEGEFISLVDSPFEIGIAHYASDTPYSKAKNLGVRNLSYEGVEPTYAISAVILKKILENEIKLINS
jgi:hypothetical protein